MSQHPRGHDDGRIHGAIRPFSPDHGLEEGDCLFIATLLEEQLSQGEPGLGEEDQVLRRHGGINGVTQRGLRELRLPPPEQLTGALQVFEGIHGAGSPAEKTAMEDKRLVELEIRYTQQQELLQELSDVLYQQGRVIDTLRSELDRLKLKLEAEPGLVDARQQERPPHY